VARLDDFEMVDRGSPFEVGWKSRGGVRFNAMRLGIKDGWCWANGGRRRMWASKRTNKSDTFSVSEMTVDCST